MGHVIFVVGLPGSGKSHYAKKLSKELNADLFDDYKANAIKDCSLFPFGRQFVDLVNHLRNKGVCIVSDIDFCETNSREDAQLCLQELVKDIQIDWQYFENNPEQCKKNIIHRSQTEQRNINQELDNLRRYTEKYNIPANVKTIEVWHGD